MTPSNLSRVLARAIHTTLHSHCELHIRQMHRARPSENRALTSSGVVVPNVRTLRSCHYSSWVFVLDVRPYVSRQHHRSSLFCGVNPISLASHPNPAH